jgi:hypothetical protein
MTGEMSRSDVTPEEYPHYFAIAKAFGGTVEPFDVYQGPYILIAKPKLAKLWLIADEQGGGATIYDSKSERQSDWFPLYTRDPNESYGMAIAAAAKVLQRAPRNIKYRAVLGAHAGRPARLTGYRPGPRGPHEFDTPYAVEVKFRVVKAGPFKGEVDAWFPKELATRDGMVTTYSHIGQHGAGQLSYMRNSTRPAKPAEYQSLKRELEGLGYVLTIK